MNLHLYLSLSLSLFLTLSLSLFFLVLLLSDFLSLNPSSNSRPAVAEATTIHISSLSVIHDYEERTEFGHRLLRETERERGGETERE